jgi:Zn-dependent protease with chaperone function
MRLMLGGRWKSAYDKSVTHSAEYFDGQTAERHDVAIEFDTTGIRIRNDHVNEHWAYGEIRYASQDSDDVPLIFKRQQPKLDAARLAVDDLATIDDLRIRCPDLQDRIRRGQQRKRGALLVTAGVLSVGLILWSSVHFLPRLLAPLLPIAWEEAIGDGVVDDIAGIFGVMTKKGIKKCETADGRLALDILVGQLAHQVKTPYQFQVIVLDIDIVNALAAPGGRIVLFKKFLTEAKSPDEVAGVLAHEMGHVISRHPTTAVARSMGLSLVFNVLIGGLGSGPAGAAGQALVNSAYSRDAEREADTIALTMLNGAKISPNGIADFFARMSKKEGKNARVTSFISSHPPSKDRAKAARNTPAADVQPALSASQWKALKSICG